MSAGSLNTYTGRRRVTDDGRKLVEVLVNGKPLEPRYDLKRHSPTGFEWGYGGSGPAQLALAILAHEMWDDFAECYYQEFKWESIATIKGDAWEIGGSKVREFAAQRLE